MLKYFTEAEEDIQMDVQVGPGEEIEADGAQTTEVEPSPIDVAKKDPETVVVAVVGDEKKAEEADGEEVAKEESCCKEFYVDAKDIEKYANLNEKTMLESLNDVISVNEEAGMTAANTVVVMSEGTKGYIRNLEKHGAACVTFKEAADEEAQSEGIEMDVQVGPNQEEIVAKEDPQEANPVDAVKKQYDTVVIAQQDKDFFVDVEDVQKCAELNCESVIETLNGIIKINEEAGVEAGNINVIVSEATDADVMATLKEAGVNCFFNEAGTTVGDISGLNDLVAVLVSTGKKVAAGFKGKGDGSSKAIQYRIDKLDEQIARVDEEIETVDESVTVGRIAKVFIGCTLSYIKTSCVVYSVMIPELAVIDAAMVKSFFKVFNKEVSFKEEFKHSLKDYSSAAVIVTAILSVIYGTVSTATILKDYKNSLKKWKKNLLELKKALEDKKKAAEKKEAKKAEEKANKK